MLQSVAKKNTERKAGSQELQRSTKRAKVNGTLGEHGLLAGQLLEHLRRTGETIARLADADVEAELLELELPHLVVVLVLGGLSMSSPGAQEGGEIWLTFTQRFKRSGLRQRINATCVARSKASATISNARDERVMRVSCTLPLEGGPHLDHVDCKRASPESPVFLKKIGACEITKYKHRGTQTIDNPHRNSTQSYM
jgi:hypothetical protein